VKINPFILVIFSCALLALTGCKKAHEPQQAGAPVVLPQADDNGLPKDKDIIYAVMLSAGLSTDIDPHCQGAGRELSDKTLGEYLSGYLADLSDFEAKNKIEVHTTEDSDSIYGSVWRVRLLITQNHDEVFWSAGLDFLIDQASRSVIPESFRCVGAG